MRTTRPASAAENQDLPINILLVDDEPKNLAVLESVLTDPCYRLVRAASADEALLALVAEEFALLVLDIQMPGMNGFELAQMIKGRKKTAGVPIIFLTAYYSEDQHVLEGYGTGAVDSCTNRSIRRFSSPRSRCSPSCIARAGRCAWQTWR